jgi:hypothetical protein
MIRRVFLCCMILLFTMVSPVSMATSARSCSVAGDASVHHITLTPGGPISMPADQTLNITAIAYNSAGTAEPVVIGWSSSSGSVQQVGGSGDVRWSPQSVGQQTVTACNGDVETVLHVNVQPGDPLTFELSVSQENITADDTLELTPLLRDQFGNGWIPNIPYADWNLPDGVDISLPNDGTPPVITPGPVGLMTVSVNWNDWSGSVTFNVTRGQAISIFIQHDSEIVSSDDLVDLCAKYTDQKGNTWDANASWSGVQMDAQESLSSLEGPCTIFDAGFIGDWEIRIHAESMQDGSLISMYDSLVLTVGSGRLAHISLDNLSTEMHIGELYLLHADGFDAAGNPVSVDGWNWSLTSGPSMDAIVADGGEMTFVPDKVGQHTIQVMAAGRVQALDVEVISGIPVELELEITDIVPSPPTIVTGSMINLTLYGVDENGNRNPVDVPIEDWFVFSDFGTIENASVGGTGHYTYTAGGIGDVSITVFLDVGTDGIEQVQGVLLIHILGGPLDHLDVLLPPKGDQGTTIPFDIAGYDVSNNPIPVHQCSAVITTDAGDTECDEDGWVLHLKKSGELKVHARIQSPNGASAEGSNFISVESTWFGWGDNTQVIIIGSLLIVVAISVILVALLKHLGSRIEEEIELLREENEDLDHAGGTSLVAGIDGSIPPPPLPQPSVVAPPVPVISPTPPVVTHVITNVTPDVQASVIPESPVVLPDPFTTLQPTIEPISEQSIGEQNVEEDWATPEPIPIKPEPTVQTDDEWGDMSENWGDGSDTLSSAAASFATIQHANRRGDGPRDSSDQPYRPLPGTVAGEDGWYFAQDGRPIHWIHSEESGWSQE